MIGNPANKNPTADPMDTETATVGEKNMAKNIGTWLANVNDAGSINTFIGMTIGMAIAIAVSKAVVVSRSVLFFFIGNLSFGYVYRCLDTF